MKAFLLEAIQYRVEKEPQREEGKMQRGFGRWPQRGNYSAADGEAKCLVWL